jgi:RNA polymerase sigma factor (sigma-70 family)
LTVLRQLKFSPSHETLFAERYGRLLSWSLQLAENDRELAEDLLHDAFIQFTLVQPDLEKIRDLDSYFYGMLRNLHLLQVRRNTRNRLQQLSVVEYDSAEDGLRTIDLRDRLQVQDELRTVCHYTCLRKESAKSASILILRFFHGYYPSEIAQLVRASRATVDVHLLAARKEARAVLANPDALAVMDTGPRPRLIPSAFAETTDGLLNELRELIFRSRRNGCLSGAHLSSIYREGSAQVKTIELAHIASCAYCLDEVNRMLKLPLLRERLASESLGPNKRGKGGGGGQGPSGGAPGGAANGLRRRARRVFEHKPQELCVSVNGHVQGSQRVNAELSELSLNVNVPEKISCIEVFSEQQVRLLLLNVDDLPPLGAAEQSSRIELSEGRTLDVTFKFRSPLPALEVIYDDPTFREVQAVIANAEERDVPGTPNVPLKQLPPASLKQRCLSFVSRHRNDAGLFIAKPSVVTALIIIVAATVAVLFSLRSTAPPPALSAMELLHRSAVSEEAIAAQPNQVIHRTINFEVRKVGPAGLIANRQIVIWQSADKGIVVRRLFDEKHALVAGDWRRKDGVQTLYHHGSRPRIQFAPERRLPGPALTADNAWQHSPSAKDLLALIGSTDAAHVEERGDFYVVTYERKDLAAEAGGLVRASLVMRRRDLHATEMTLLWREGGVDAQVVEYRFTESAFESKPISAVAPAVFEPDAELLSFAVSSAPGKRELSSAPSPAPATASTDLEVEVLLLLHSARADLDDQTAVIRTPDGRLRITGLVETTERKSEILRALSPVAKHPALSVEIKTVAEALAAQKQPSAFLESPAISVDNVEARANMFPAYAELRNHLSDEEAHAFATRIVGRTREAMRHAWALKRLMSEFSPAELRALAPAARAKWLSLVHAHAGSFKRETVAMRQDLQAVFAHGFIGDAQGGLKISSDADLDQAIERLFQLSSANDQVIRSAFTISSAEPATTAIRSVQFWRALRDVENLSNQIIAYAD